MSVTQHNVEIQKGSLEEILALAFAPVVALSELIKNASDAAIIPKDTIQIDIDTKNCTIFIKDNGSGFSKEDIENLSIIGFSNKMLDQNIFSRINEPYAGNKGLGILTAFNLCDTLNIFTYSSLDKQGYKISWQKGTSSITYENTNEIIAGTEIKLNGVSEENIRLLIMPEEMLKLYLSSITYYLPSQSLPQINVYIDGIEKNLLPAQQFETYYKEKKIKPKGKKQGYFVAKATFKYENHQLHLSYEDNISQQYNFANEVIDLNSLNSLISFLNSKNLKSSQYKNIWNEFDKETRLDDFEGVFYVWRNTRDEDILTLPSGIRIYINNYGLYNYLNKNNDWLHHSEISQNKKATNYKLKNTYGYVNFKKFKEATSCLKISKERNDFVVNLAQKKFIYIMKEFISGIFSDIDIAVKKSSMPARSSKALNPKCSHKTITIGDNFQISDLFRTDILLDDIHMEYDKKNILIDSQGQIQFLKRGQYFFSFSYNDETLNFDVIVEDKVPSFDLKKNEVSIIEGNTLNLQEMIKIGSLKNLNVEDIKISSQDAIIKSKVFTTTNLPSEYTIRYSYDGDIPISKTLKVIVIELFSNEANKIKRLYPRYCNRTPKIIDIINAIADSYVRNPTVAMIAIRPLIEVSLKSFISTFPSTSENNYNSDNFAILGELGNLYNKIKLQKIENLDPLVLNKYHNDLLSSRKKTIDHYQKLDLNGYIHEHTTHATSTDVLETMKRFHLVLSFIIEALNATSSE